MSTDPNHHRFCLLLLGLALFAGGALAGPCAVDLRPRATVEGTHVRLLDVAGITGGDGVAFDVGAVFLGPVPAAGTTVTFTRHQVEQRLLAHGFSRREVQVTGAPRVRVAREGGHREAVSEKTPTPAVAKAAEPAPPATVDHTASIAAAVKQYVRSQWSGADLKVEVRVAETKTGPFKGGTVSLFRVLQSVPARPVGSVRLRLGAYDGKQLLLGHVDVRATVSVERPVLVAARQLARGAILQAEDLTLEHQDVRRVHGALVRRAAVVGRQLTRSLAPGQAVDTQCLRVPPVVARGEPVTVVAHHGSMVVTHRGVALQTGGLGQVVEVRNQNSGKSYPAVIVGPGQLSLTP